MLHHSPPVLVIDVAALMAILGSFAGALPAIAAGFAALYYIFAVFDIIHKWKKKEH